MNHTLVLHLGSNLGNRLNYLNTALQLLETGFGPPLKISRIYETKAWGINEQPDFLNTALVYQTHFIPNEVLKKIKIIETETGRMPREHWHEREIDIDIIFYGNEIIKEQNLEIPHNKMHLRRFVLQPLVEIIPEFVHPVLNKSNLELLAECKDTLEVNLWNQ